MSTRRAARGPRWPVMLPALLAVLALASWTGGLRTAAAGTLGSSSAALAADADALLGAVGERSGSGPTTERDPTGGRSGPGAAGRAGGPGAAASQRAGASPYLRLLGAPEDAALRRLERAGRTGAPTTAPPLAS